MFKLPESLQIIETLSRKSRAELSCSSLSTWVILSYHWQQWVCIQKYACHSSSKHWNGHIVKGIVHSKTILEHVVHRSTVNAIPNNCACQQSRSQDGSLSVQSKNCDDFYIICVNNYSYINKLNKKRKVPFSGPCHSKTIRKNPNNFTDLHCKGFEHGFPCLFNEP